MLANLRAELKAGWLGLTALQTAVLTANWMVGVWVCSKASLMAKLSVFLWVVMTAAC